MGSNAKKLRRERNRALKDFLCVTPQGDTVPIKAIGGAADALEDLASPFADVIQNDQVLYYFAVMGWNLSFLPPENQAAAMKDVLDSYAGDDPKFRELVGRILEAMARRKTARYPDNRFTFVSPETAGG